MAAKQHNEIPVLPGEARSLPQHVERCAERYTALLNWHYVISKRLRAMRFESWLYRGATLILLGFVAWYLRELGDRLPLVVPR